MVTYGNSTTAQSKGLPAHHLLQSHHVQSNVDSTAATHVEREGEKEIERVLRDSMPHASVETGSPSKSISVQQRSRNGSVSKPCTPSVHIKIAGIHGCSWMFIPTKNGIFIGIDPYPNNPCNILEKTMKELMHPCRRFLAPTTGRPQEDHLGHRYIWCVWWRHVLNAGKATAKIWHGVIWSSTNGGFTGISNMGEYGG